MSHPFSPPPAPAAAPPGNTPGWLSLALFGAATVGVVALLNAGAGVASPRTLRWYEGLEKPGYKPPDPVIPAVWSVMYTLMTVSAWRVWRTEPSPARNRALATWAAQLGLNGLWTRLFFGHKRPALALADSAALVAGVAAYARAADRVDRPAALMVLPYLGWVGFATVLNAGIVRRNP